ncbi:hypothetical protein [Dactylosporangium sp. CA-092794]|uniref:hypothetical protein n=1 Tax=Dactylosporangium sp. CA-092794 TaxID=3239929 RepID=UPI003D8C35D1
MPSPRPQVWMADAVRALAAFPGEDRRTLLELLGGERRPAGPPPAAPPPEPDREAARPPEPLSPTELPRLNMLEPIRRTAPRPASADAPVRAEPAPVPVAPLAHRPLLAPGRDRRVLHAALARARPTHRLDVARAVERVVRIRSLDPVPVEAHAGLVAGSELLVDIGAGMQPFDADADDLIRAAYRLAGGAHLRTVRFRQVPTRPAGAGTGPVWTWTAYRLPPRRVAVVFVTDLGVSAPLPDAVPAAAFEWAELFDHLARRDVVPVVLTPYRPARVPAALRRRALIVQWDGGLAPRSITGMVRERTRRLR